MAGVPRMLLLTKYGVVLPQLLRRGDCELKRRWAATGWNQQLDEGAGGFLREAGAGERDGLRESSQSLHLHEQNSRVAHADGDWRWGLR